MACTATFLSWGCTPHPSDTSNTLLKRIAGSASGGGGGGAGNAHGKVGLQVDGNGTAKGTINGDDFGKVFLSIWPGAEPPNPEIKEGLLGGACG